MKRYDLDPNDLRQRYGEGVSEKALAEYYGVSRSVVRRRLLELGVERRGRSAALRERLRQIGAEGRADLARSANDARRGRSIRDSEVEAKAVWRETSRRFASPREGHIGEWLLARGVITEPQKAVGRYNLDLAVGAVAVELHWSPGNPARRRTTRERSHYLLDRGWSVLYVWVGRDGVLAEACADEIVAFLQLVERLPPGIRQYRVIRGSGKHVMTVGFDADQAAVVPAPKAHARL